MKNTFLFILLLVVSIPLLKAQPLPQFTGNELLKSGPMLGYSEMREVMVWVQTKFESSVYITYFEKNKGGQVFQTTTYKTTDEQAFIAKIIIADLEPGKTYTYSVYINGVKAEFEYETEFQTIPLWQYRTDPPNFTFAIGSCLYINDEAYDRPGKPYGGNYEILTSIAQKKPDAMLWLGDNTYYREADWNTKSGMVYRNTHTRSLPQLQELLANSHNYAIWDDHDYGPNDHNRSFIHKDVSLEVFKMFWANPSFGFKDEKCAVSQFSWGDAEVFMLDNRWFRAANNLKDVAKADYFGEKQIDWLIESLKASKSNFKIIATGGQILNTAKVYENYANYAKERAYLLKRIKDEKITGVIFLSGDRHHTELTALPQKGGYTIYDLTVSPLTSGSHAVKDEGNKLQVEGTIVAERNFGILTFKGLKNERELIISIYDVNGIEKWSKSIKASELR